MQEARLSSLGLGTPTPLGEAPGGRHCDGGELATVMVLGLRRAAAAVMDPGRREEAEAQGQARQGRGDKACVHV